ncbi:MAG TPA: GNAT family N-acetyltransferase [Actinospica sp.]|nr:GNAT family N-acetyltransferase [Actinospica sp.]
MPAIPPPPDRIADALLELRPLAEWDIPELLIAHQDDPELHRRLGAARPPTGAELGRQVEEEPTLRAAGAGVTLTIVEPGGHDCRGRVEVDGIDWASGSARVRVWVIPQLRGRGYEQRAADLAADWLRASVGLEPSDVQLFT